MNYWHIKICIALLIPAFCNGCLMLPIPYKGYPHKQFQGRIIDKSTQQPISGASVYYSYLIFGIPFPKEGIMVRKSMTDTDGKFTIEPIHRYWNVFWIVPYRWGPPDEKYLSVEKGGYDHLTVALHEQNHRINWILLEWDYTLFKPSMEGG